MNDFISTVDNDSWIVTPNNRLSQSLQSQYARQQNVPVFIPLTILPYEEFLLRIFQQLLFSDSKHSHPVLLNSYQLNLLVADIVNQNAHASSNESLIQTIIESWKRCAHWEIPIETRLFSTNHQTQLFCKWIQRIQDTLMQMNALASPQLADYLQQHALSLPCKTIAWYGFDDLTPQQQSLQHWIKKGGTHNTMNDVENFSTPIVHYAANNEQDEQQQWLAWLKQPQQSGKKLGVILPDLAEQATAVHRMMRRHFSEEAFNISLGQPLASFPLAAHALCCLSLSNETKLENRQIKLLLHSSFIGEAQTELHGRSQLLNEQNLMQHRQLGLKMFIQRCRRHAPLLSKRLQALSSYPPTASPFDWVNHFDKRLQQMGFPGEISLNSASYQCYQRFSSALNEFRSLHLVRQQMSRQEAIEQFHYLLQQIVFQPQASATASIHISGLLEASGIPYDGLWIAGMTDLSFPQPVRYSPFIPVPLQQQKQMPHASFEREQTLAEIILRRFQRSSSELICSYPKLRGEQPNLPSPFISHTTAYQTIALVAPSQCSMEDWEEIYHLPLQDCETIYGGTGVLSNQAKCPFKAFAAHRLHCENLVYEQDGLEKREQGTFIHHVMEILWQRIKTQDHLLAFSEGQLDALISEACDTVLNPYLTSDLDAMESYTLNIERQRLSKLAKECLTLDMQRPPFEVFAIEAEGVYPLGSHSLRIKIDRVDQEINGNKWLIDYKSSIPARIPWDKERPEEPQLILYALQDQDIKTISYLQLKPGDVKYKGLSHHGSDMEGITAPKKNHSWETYQQQWNHALSMLEKEFVEGRCAPDPLRDELCNSCEFSSLCRFPMRQTED